MVVNFLEVTKFLFKISCFIIVFCLVGVWVLKYMQDEDLCLVEYKPFGNTNQMGLPGASLCITEPFIEDKLNDHGTNTTAYIKYLSGDYITENLASINYTNVTLNLGSNYIGTGLLHKNGSITHSADGVIRSSLSAFYYRTFMKCYTMDMENSEMFEINYAKHLFKADPFLQRGLSSKMIYALAHGPHQSLLTNNIKVVSFDANDIYGGDITFKMSKIELVKTRNKPKSPFVMQWRDWDEFVSLRHIKDIGCIPPYYESHQNVPICSTMKEMKRWYNILATIRNEREYMHCQQMPGIDFEIYKGHNRTHGTFTISIGYPELVKIITQSRAVDVNALIGNLGGYIGLFLGMHDISC